MFDEIDRAYFQRRAAQEHAQAEHAASASVARIHRALAREYERQSRAFAEPQDQVEASA